MMHLLHILQSLFTITLPPELSDIDECGEGVVDIGGTPSLFWCDQQCVNTAGWYECTCDMGYHLDTDNKTCLGIML